MLEVVMEWLFSLRSQRFRAFRTAKQAYEDYVATNLAQRGIGFDGLNDEGFAVARRDATLTGAVENYRAAINGCREDNAITDLATARYQLGMLHHLRGEFAEAECQLCAALAMLGDIIELTRSRRQTISGCHYHLGIIAWRRGNTNEAIERLEQSLEIDAKIIDLQGESLTRRALERVRS